EGDEEEAAPWMAPPSRRRKDTLIAGPLPKILELTLANQIYIAKEVLPPTLRNRLIRLAAFQNPEFYKAQAMRLSTYDKPRIIACAEDHPKHIGLPRGCLDDLLQSLSDLNIKTVVRDQRRPGHACSGHGSVGSHHSVWQDRGGSVADCPTRRQYARIGASTAIATAMDRATFYLLGNAGRRHWPDRRRPRQAHWPTGCRGDPEPRTKRSSR